MKVQRFTVENVFRQCDDLVPSKVVANIRIAIIRMFPKFIYKMDSSGGCYTIFYALRGSFEDGSDGYEVCYMIESEKVRCGSLGGFYIKVWMDVFLFCCIEYKKL